MGWVVGLENGKPFIIGKWYTIRVYHCEPLKPFAHHY
jgi:hypothetical protein